MPMFGTMNEIRVGADLMSVQDVADSVARFGDRYLNRIYTEHELSSCQGLPSVVAAGLAARFAAKEATIKALRPTGHQPDWRSIEVRRHPEGWCDMHLTGEAARMADEARVGSVAVSLSHEDGMAAAVVVLLCENESEDQ